MRGFEKRQWTIEVQPAVPEKIPPQSMTQALTLASAHGDQPGGEVHQTLLFNKEVYKNPFTDMQYPPIRIDLWDVKKRPSDSGIGLHKVERVVLLEVMEGVARVEVLKGIQASTFELRKGERLWIPSGAAMSLRSSGGQGKNSAIVRRLEFP